MYSLSKGQKITLTIIGLVLVVLLMVIFGRPYNPPAATPQKTADQVEQEDLVKKIESGSLLWKDHQETINALKRDLEVEMSEQKKVENYVTSYRSTLCAKFALTLTASGTLANSPECAAMSTVSFQ